MLDETLRQDSLVLYKNRPGRISQVGEKLEVTLENGKTVRVRPKDVTLLHAGPIRHLSELAAPAGEVETAWELLAGETTTLAELAELIYDDFTPASAWATWQLIDEGLYFRGSPEAVTVAQAEEVAQAQATRQARLAERQAWADFIERAGPGELRAEDGRFLSEVEQVALGQLDKSRVLRELARPESPESAHALLLDLGYWQPSHNPYPQRAHLASSAPALSLPSLPAEGRLDLTHLPALAIDDAGSSDPDDALSLDGERLWVHVADVAAVIPPDSLADVEARARGANLYLPEMTVPMLPAQATELLALGLAEISPALSFGLDVGPGGEVMAVEIKPSWVRVERWSYEQAEARLGDEPFAALADLAERSRARRLAHGAIDIDLPEVKARVEAGQVVIHPLPPLKSRSLVQEAMLLAGEAVARLAREAAIPFPYTGQEPPDEPDQPRPEGLAGMFARRLSMKPGQVKSVAGPHAGLGLEIYARVTSPLRRYLDLVAHQQLRAYLAGKPLLSEAAMLERVGAAEAVSGEVRRAERLANQHWTLVYLMQHPDWQGEGVVVEQRNRNHTVLIPELAYETRLTLPGDPPLNSRVQLAFRRVNLPELSANFRVIH
jgi:exoribonuclease-2